MLYYVRASKDVGKDPQSFDSVVEAGIRSEGKEPAVITFGGLGSPQGSTVSVMEDQGAPVKLGQEPYVVRAIGISSCAAVCFRYQDESKVWHAYLYHANTGKVPHEKFLEIMKELEVPENRYKRVQVLYAHPGESRTYHEYMDQLERWLRGATVVGISHLPGQIFAMNQSTAVGY